jgi:hypothetical protein
VFSLAAGQLPPAANVTIQRFDPQPDTAVSGEPNKILLYPVSLTTKKLK